MIDHANEKDVCERIGVKVVTPMNEDDLIEWVRASGYEIVTIEPGHIGSFNPFEDTIIDDKNNENGRDFNQTLRELGFDGEVDFFNCLIRLDLSKPEKATAYEEWKRTDGTKEGLQSIL